MLKTTSPWVFVVAVGLLAAGARYGLIQPVTLAHQCDAGAGPWWCTVRTWVIYTYAWYGLGYASIVLALLSVLLRHVWVATLTLAVSSAALILYCYEPGAFGLVVGVLVLARAQAHRSPGGASTPRHQHA